MKSLWGQGEKYLRIRRSAIDISPGVARMLVIGLIFLVAAIFIVSDVGLWNLWHAQKTLDMIDKGIMVGQITKACEIANTHMKKLKGSTASCC